MADDPYEPIPWSSANTNSNEEYSSNEESNSHFANPLQFSQEPLQQDSTDDSSLSRKTHNTANRPTFSHSENSPFQIVQPYHRRLVPDQIHYPTDPQRVHNPRQISESDNFNWERQENQYRQAIHYPTFYSPPSHYHRGYANSATLPESRAGYDGYDASQVHHPLDYPRYDHTTNNHPGLGSNRENGILFRYFESTHHGNQLNQQSQDTLDSHRSETAGPNLNDRSDSVSSDYTHGSRGRISNQQFKRLKPSSFQLSPVLRNLRPFEYEFKPIKDKQYK